MASIYRKLPKLVGTLCQVFDGIIIGGSVDWIINQSDNKPTDIDVVIPYNQWMKACKCLPQSAVINSCGGFKVIENDIEIDVWMDDVARIICDNSKPIKAYCPKTNTLIIGQKYICPK